MHELKKEKQTPNTDSNGIQSNVLGSFLGVCNGREVHYKVKEVPAKKRIAFETIEKCVACGQIHKWDEW